MRRRRNKLPQDLQDERAAWAAAQRRCFVCRGLPDDVHEIASKGQTVGHQWACVESYFATCRWCHDEILSWAPEAVQLALKSIEDKSNLNIPLINQLRGRGPNAIDIYEVRNWERFIRAVRGERI